jgi:hypothetical protein
MAIELEGKNTDGLYANTALVFDSLHLDSIMTIIPLCINRPDI